MFFGVISFGDSGSGANTLAGDTVGANMQAAGILTHIWLPWTDLGQRAGLGTMAGTPATNTLIINNPFIEITYPIRQDGSPVCDTSEHPGETKHSAQILNHHGNQWA